MKKVIAILAITALIITGLIIYQRPVNSITTQATPLLNADTIFDLVNQERIKAGVKPLARDIKLDATAQERADDMVARNYFSHYDPVSGENLVYIKPKVKECIFASENIVQILYETPMENNQEAVFTWMNSKPHHDAILDAQYDTSGLAISDNKIVQHFCNLK